MLEPNQKESLIEISPALHLVTIVGELGLIISLPLVVLVFFAVKLDTYFGTTPAIILAAMVVSAVISSVIIRRKVRRLNSLRK